MIHSTEIVDESLTCLTELIIEHAGRGEDWWFSHLLRRGAWATPCALTGTQIGVLAALSLDQPRPIQITVQPHAPFAEMIDAVRQCHVVADTSLQSLMRVLSDLDDGGVAAHLAVGSVVDPTIDEARLYVGCPDDGNHEALVAVLSRSNPLWFRLPSPRPRSAPDPGRAGSVLIGVARRFGARQEYVHYFAIDEDIGPDVIRRVADTLGAAAVARLHNFWSRVMAGCGSAVTWGWAVTTRPDGSLRYLKLEASVDPALLMESGLIGAPLDFAPYTNFVAGVARSRLRLVPQTLSCAVGAVHHDVSCYFAVEFADDPEDDRTVGLNGLPPAGRSLAENARDKALRPHF